MAHIISLRCRQPADTRPRAQVEIQTAIDEVLGLISQCVSNIVAGNRPNIELSQLGPHLLHLIALVGRESSVETAADALYGTAQRIAYSAASEKQSSAERLQRLDAAYMLLRSRALIAEPIVLDLD